MYLLLAFSMFFFQFSFMICDVTAVYPFNPTLVNLLLHYNLVRLVSFGITAC